MERHLLLAWVITGCFLTAPALADNWPQFHYDAGRTAASPAALSAELELHWTREFAEPQPAYPHEVRLGFDASYEPVVAEGTMFVPSMVHDSVTALDAQTGEQQWRFFTGGPVRFAPVVWRERVYFVSDDGYLYCVDATEGELQWKFRGLPADKPHRHVMGNERLISLWAARGGPVLADGVIYFAAGLWPTEGVFVHAVDAESGEGVWTNTESDRIPEANWDHGVGFEAGLTPQGYLAIVGDWLVVPGGTQLPAFFDLETGELHDYTMGWGGRVGQPKGTWFVAGIDDYLVHAGDLYDVTRPYERDAAPGYGRWLYPGGWTRLEMDPANQKRLGQAFRRPVLTAETIYESGGEGIRARDLTSMTLRPRDEVELPSYRENEFHPDTFIATFDQLWNLPSEHAVHMKAGDFLYAAGPGVVEAIDTAVAEGPTVVWQAEIEGTPHRLLTAGGRLFVVTAEGSIFAFGERRDAEPIRHTRPTAAAEAAEGGDRAEQAEAILESTDVREGYALVLGIDDGGVVEQLVRQSDLHVIAVDDDAETVAALRERLNAAELYGTRVGVLEGDPAAYPFPPYLARLIVSEDADGLLERAEAGALAEGIFHALQPYGGVAWIGGSSASLSRLEQIVQDEEAFFGASVRPVDDDAMLLTRTGPLPGSGDWSHSAANAANTGASRDAVRSPLAVLWFDSQRYHRQPGHLEVRVSGGRLVILESGLLRAADIYTGRMLWEVEVPIGEQAPADPLAREAAHRRGRPGNLEPSTDMVVVEDAIYISDGTSCRVFDPATGEAVGRIDLPDDLEAPWVSLRVWGDYLVGCSDRTVVAVDRHTGELLWRTELGRDAISLAVGDGKVFCAEVASLRRGEDEAEDGTTRALDIATGEVVWQRPGGAWLRYSPSQDLLVTPVGFYRGADGELVTRLPERLVMRTNVPRWLSDRVGPMPEEGVPGFIAGQQLLTGSDDDVVAYAIPSGERIGELSDWSRRGCTSLRASTHMLSTRYRSNSAWIDLASGEVTPFLGVRPACHSNNNMFPANGVFTMPNFSGGCTCNFSPMSVGFAPAAAVERDASAR